jgi:hypothetical protein
MYPTLMYFNHIWDRIHIVRNETYMDTGTEYLFERISGKYRYYWSDTCG